MNILDHPTDKPYLSDREIFTRIWTSPRETFRYLEQSQYEKYFFTLLVLTGIAKSLTKAVAGKAAGDTPFWEVFIQAIVVGGLAGWISIVIYAFFVRWIGTLLGGKADINSVLRVLAYSSIPTVTGLLLILFQIWIYGAEIFQQEMNPGNGEFFSNYMLMSVVIPQGILTIWSIVLLVIGLSEVQKFSITDSIFNLLLPIVLIALTGALLVGLMMSVFGTA